jgi:hypothetical protein
MGRADFSGVTQPVITAPDEIREVMSMPPGYESIGELSIPCSDSRRTDAFAVLNTVGDCSLDRMVEVLKKEASRVGGELLVQRHCDTDSHVSKGFDGAPVSSETMHCRAVVARRIAPGNAGTTHGVPNSQLPKALRAAPDVAPLDPAVVDATAPYDPSCVPPCASARGGS